MKREDYERLRQALDQPFGTCVNMESIRKRFPGMQHETLLSIYSQETQNKVIRSNHVHKRRIGDYCARYLAGEDILSICASVDFPPCMMLRRMLESMLLVSKQAIGSILKDPGLLRAAVRAEPAPTDALLERLQADIQRCVMADTCYSPLSDLAKQAAGLEHELLLADHLRALDIPFWTELDLRAQGYFKTPDIWLHVPMAVRDRSSGAWRLVSWIDSKATFGDDAVHSRQMEEQYATYLHRYGPGLVIYWFGCLEDLAAQNASVMVLDAFPQPQDVATLPNMPLI